MSDYIDPDVVCVIMKILPLKKVLQCRSVCKSWKESIDSKWFRAEHLGHQSPRLIAQNKPCEYLIIDPRALPKFDTLRCPIQPEEEDDDDEDVTFNFEEGVCSVMGVICFNLNNVLYLWNPIIHRLAKIPQPNHPFYRACGFWIDPCPAYTCKIVIYYPTRKKISVFSSRNRTWKEVAGGVRIAWRGRGFRQVLINGVGHWLALLGGVPCCRVGIAYFDFVQERFGTIALPKEFTTHGEIMNVGKWHESLSVLTWGWRCECNVWAMQSGSWSKVLTFDLVSHNVRVRNVLCVDEAGTRALLQVRDGSLVLYDSRPYNRVALSLDFLGRADFSVAYEFVESFVFPDLPSVEA